MKRIKMAEYQELINKLRMCRSDLDENIIVAETQKIASSDTYTIQDVLCSCIELAMEGNQMPWETDNQSLDSDSESDAVLE